MKTKRLFQILLYTISLAFRGEAQDFTKGDIDSVQWKIYDYLQTHDRPSYDTIKSEVLMILVETDSNSNIIDIHLLADNKNQGVTYGMLSKMTVADFKGWHPANFRNKIIMVPVYSRGIRVESGYAEKSFWRMSLFGSVGYIVNKDQKSSVLLSGLRYHPTPTLTGE